MHIVLQCPQSLLGPLIKMVIEKTRNTCSKHPIDCGFNPSENVYEPLKLMQTVIAKTNDICLRYLDNSNLCSLPSPGPPYNTVSACAVKNSRRYMEDRHVIIHDLAYLFSEEEVSPSSYYAIFDGHAGHIAAAYSSSHLHQFLAESRHFISDPEQAFKDAFLKTDALFLDKCNTEQLSSGTTAVCALLRHKEKTLYIAWVGDSQALLVSVDKVLQCVWPHKPAREDERHRIEQLGGCVIYWGTWRVNGQLAVSRAIGDYMYKPYVTAVPDVMEISLTGNEDFLILACDGLWDFITEDEAARCIYEIILENPDDINYASQSLVQLAKQKSSTDNISVIVVLLRETSKIAAEARRATRNNSNMDTTLDNANTATNPFAINSNNAEIMAQKEGFVLNLADSFKQNGTEKSPTSEFDFMNKPTNGKRSAEEFDDDDDDMGPETDVDAVDDVLLSPAIAAAKSLAEGIINNNANLFDPFCEKEEKAILETGSSDVQKQETVEFDTVKSHRDETPTPPADSVLDASGLVDNVAESGEDSDDEWNYYKGDTVADKENTPPTQTDTEVCEALESDTMSQLNPNAAEFIPISPKRNMASPTYQALIDDPVITQSPRRTTNNDINVDINIPNPQEFECEIKSRPSDVHDCANGDDLELNKKLSSQEIMENFLNGRNIDEIEFQPNSTPTKLPKPDEFHFGPNAAPFSTPAKFDQSEALSTKAVFGDESSSSYLDAKAFDSSFASSDTCEAPICSKEQDDPMSMSFYQEQENETNPFDLNKVQVLPEDIDEFLVEKPKDDNSLLNDTISDLPEHNPLDKLDKEDNIKIIKTEDQEDKVETVPLESKSPILDTQTLVLNAKSPTAEIQSVDSLSLILENEMQSFIPRLDPPEAILQCEKPENNANLEIQTETTVLQSQSPILQLVCSLPQEEFDRSQSQSPISKSESPHSEMESQTQLQLSLQQSQSPIPQLQSPIPQTQSPLLQSQSPILQSHSPLPQSQSPLFQSQSTFGRTDSPLPQAESPLSQAESPLPQAESSLPQAEPPLPQAESPLPQTKSPLLQAESPLPHTEFLVSQSESPLPQPRSPLPQSRSPLPQSQSPPPQSHSPLPQSQSPLPQSPSPLILQSQSPIPQSDSPIPQSQSPAFLSHSLIPQSKSPVLQTELYVETQSPLPTPQSPLPTPQSPLPELESPVEDITSSVKDSPLMATSPVENENRLIDEVKEPSDNLILIEEKPISFVQEVLKAEADTATSDLMSQADNKTVQDLISDTCLISTPKSVASEQVDTESVVTADVNSFLERSLVPEMTSPMSVNSEYAHDQEVKNILDNFTSTLETHTIEILNENDYKTNILESTNNIDFHVKSEIIAPEYPIQMIATPSEESKTEDLMIQNEVIKSEENKEKVAEALAATTVVAAAVATTTAVQKKASTTKTVSKTSNTASKKLSTPKTSTSPTKAPPVKTTTKPASTARSTASTTAQKTSSHTIKSTTTTTKSAPLTAVKTTPKSRTSATTTMSSKVTEKKPLMNGDVKHAIGATLTVKKTPSTTASKPTLKPVPSKLSPTKTENKTSTNGSTRPVTAPAKPTATKITNTSRPTSLVTKTTTTTARLSSITSTVAANKGAPKTSSTTSTSPKTTMATMKPRPSTAPTRSKAPTSKPVPKAPDTEKQIKETANKQLTAASRNLANKTATGRTNISASTGKKLESKTTGTSRTLVSKTSTTTKADLKKPTEITRHTTVNKTSKGGVITKKTTKTEQNGIITEINTVTTMTFIEPQLVKDVSPVIENLVLDNLQISETNVTD